MRKQLWEDYFYDQQTNQWTKDQTSVDKDESRGFNFFIMKPISNLYRFIEEGNIEGIKKVAKKQGFLDKISKEDLMLSGKDLQRKVFRKWIDVADSVLDMCCNYLPSPKEAQLTKIGRIYHKYHEQEDEEEKVDPEDYRIVERAMEQCDPLGPASIFISKIIPFKQQTMCFGRIFSGTIKTGDKVKVYTHDQDKGTLKTIQNVGVCMGKYFESIGSMPCGNTVVLGGIDSAIKKEATVCDAETKCQTFKHMKFAVAPVVQVAIRAKKAVDIDKLDKGLRKLSKVDQLVQISRGVEGEYVLAGAGDLHVEISISQLSKPEFAGCEFIVSEPTVSYRETIVGDCEPQLTKSSNKLNRIFTECLPIDPELTDLIEQEQFGEKQKDELARILRDKYDWDPTEIKKLWALGIEDYIANMIGDKTVGMQYMKEVKPNIIMSFQDAIREGPLCQEKMRGVYFRLTDAKLHSDAPHRGVNQINPMARNGCYAAFLASQPRLQEPIFLCTIKTEEERRGDVYTCIGNRRGKVISDEYDYGQMITIKAHLPVSESFGFATYLRDATQGRAQPMTVFDHWETIESDLCYPFEEGSMANTIVKQIRERKGLDLEIPKAEKYSDRL